jgi:hypothetical protein
MTPCDYGHMKLFSWNLANKLIYYTNLKLPRSDFSYFEISSLGTLLADQSR